MCIGIGETASGDRRQRIPFRNLAKRSLKQAGQQCKVLQLLLDGYAFQLRHMFKSSFAAAFKFELFRLKTAQVRQKPGLFS